MMTLKALSLVSGSLCVSLLVMTGVPKPALGVAWRWPIYCFFSAGSSDITDGCERIIGEAIASWHLEQEGRQLKSDFIDPKDPYAPPYKATLTILGYAPDAISPALADTLSVSRAAAVARRLEMLGIPEDLVTIIGLGDKQPLAPGSALDPTNRMVRIWFY